MPATTPAKQHQNGNTPRRIGNRLEREHVADIQRARMLTAMAEVACEQGAANVTVAHVVERAGVSRRTFYELFADRDDCLLAAVEEAIDRVTAQVLPAYERPGTWRERIRAGLIALLSFLEEEPYMGHLLIVETLAAGRVSLGRRNEALAHVVRAVDGGWEASTTKGLNRQVAAEGAVGAALSVLHARLSRDEQGSPIELAGPLMSMIVLPYLGPAAARRELERPAPHVNEAAAHATANPLKQLGMRLTYRTARVLLAVAESPGASNRMVGTGAGIGDQGQISKLLSRLEKLGLVVNAGLPRSRGMPNAWTLTEQGEEVRRALAGRI